jgi:putative transposase
LHPIIVRGIHRRKIFLDDRDRDDFLNRLGRILSDTRPSCFAWSLMATHCHLLLRTGSVPIATEPHRLLTEYALRVDRRHQRCAHWFQNRYNFIKLHIAPSTASESAAGGRTVVEEKGLKRLDIEIESE